MSCLIWPRRTRADPDTERYALFDAVVAAAGDRLRERTRRPHSRRPSLGRQAHAAAVAASSALRRARARADRRHVPQHRSRPLPSSGGDARRPSPRRLRRSPCSSAGSTRTTSPRTSPKPATTTKNWPARWRPSPAAIRSSSSRPCATWTKAAAVGIRAPCRRGFEKP